MPQKVVNYDGYDYDYSTYWENRGYENEAEHIVLNKLLKNESGEWFIDIGGSYGRLTDTYSDKYKNCIILDYSFKTLAKNKSIIKESFPNTYLIAANAYKTPFKDSVFDGGLMVRVLHHIEEQENYFREVSRVLHKDSMYIQEFANKRHIKARIRALLSRDKSIKNEQPYQQPCINLEGAKGNGVYFLNYHPKFISKLMENVEFKIEKKQGCSYFRVPILKKIFGKKLLILFEKIFQILFAKSDIPPSIFLKSILIKGSDKKEVSTLQDLLVCPKCKGNLHFKENSCLCDQCNTQYFKKEGIWDFRVD